MSFDSWFQDIWGYPPFPWQVRLAETIPDAVGVPTASGKTAIIDAWLYRWLHGQASRRLWYIVDRRVLVDAAYERAKRLQEKHPDVAAVRLRGGVFEDGDDLPLPHQPAIICSTVDQFGSRMLFRGYGVGRSSLPLHAALAGTDSLVALDEAHISEPLRQTITRAVELGATVNLLPMSATLSDKYKDVLFLNDDDRENEVLNRRLVAHKLAKLTTKSVVAEAKALRKGGAKSVIVWCNTVDSATSAFEQLSKHDETILITGRDRELDRDELTAKWWPRLKAGSQERPQVYVVSTQCLEVGADLDFDGLVSECASLDTLVQRFGRLDRLGTSGITQAAICKPKGKRPPVYGDAALRTWEWLNSIRKNDAVDFGASALPSAPAECSLPTANAPTMLPAHLDAWSMTSVRSESIPDVAPWLHGIGHTETDVRVCWRDLPPNQDDWPRARHGHATDNP